MRILFIVFFLSACSSLTPTGSAGNQPDLLADAVFAPTIKTVQLYPDRNDVTNVLLPAAVAVTEQQLRLEFDDLVGSYQSYNVKITHCNSDWTKSTLANLDFLSEYNSFPVNQYAYSSDTHIPYVHYWFAVPRVRLSGNYVLTVYMDDTTPVLSKRFMVYEKQVQLASIADVSGSSRLSNKQGISLMMQYSKLDVNNPATQFELNIRQNQRWDNMIVNIPPVFYRDAQKEIEYRVNDEEYMHDGGNEYRYIDLRTILNTGQHITKIDRKSKPYTAFVDIDKSYQYDRYATHLDFNGTYVIQNFDNSLQYSENYVKTVFTLALSEPLSAPVHLSGKLITNPLSRESEMQYDSIRKEYRKELLLKQGWYNYQYIVQDKTNPFRIEGNHFETENSYEVLVYYKSLQPRADLLVGYLQFTKNPH
jgi:hypothetical protein